MHIVEVLIRERAARLISRKRIFPLIKPFLYRLLNYQTAVQMADEIANMSGHQAFDYIAGLLSANIQSKNLHHVPQTGPCIIISNHPTGLADGLALYGALRDHRPDLIFLANADALRVVPEARDIIIPIEWVKTKRSQLKSRQSLIDIRTAFKDERPVIIFPSGRLAHLRLTGLIDKPWESSAAMLAKKYNIPIIPLRIRARNSLMYYLFSWTNAELRDITLFHELLNKRGQTFRLTFGAPIHPEDLSKNAEAATAHIRNIVEKL